MSSCHDRQTALWAIGLFLRQGGQKYNKSERVSNQIKQEFQVREIGGKKVKGQGDSMEEI